MWGQPSASPASATRSRCVEPVSGTTTTAELCGAAYSGGIRQGCHGAARRAVARAVATAVTTLARVSHSSTADKLDDLHRRVAEGPEALASAAVEKQGKRGKKSARDRIDALLDEGSFVELDAFATHRSSNFGLDKRRVPGDGVVVGYGTIEGHQVCIYSQDFTVFGGSLGEVHGQKITKVMDLALRTGVP